MSEALQRLHRDHANAFRLLGMLEKQIEFIDGGKRAQWDIVQEIIQYFLTYPDSGHHPLEDKILALLRSRAPEEAKPYLWLDSEHRQLSESLHHMAAVTPRVVPIVRAHYLDLLRGFIAHQRDHVHREEAGFFPAARRLLDGKDWRELDRMAADMSDPLADPADLRFRTLRRQLSAAGANEGASRPANGGV
jgi:hemerythrin-like domain-containing protein